MKLTFKDFAQYKTLGLSIVGIPKSTEYLNDEGKSKKKVIFPRGGWAQYQKKFATRGEIENFESRGSEMIGLITGKLSGIVVIDVDEEHSKKYNFLQKTPMRVKSSLSGGIHYYFKWDDDLDEYGNATKIMGYPMDYRGRGGLVFAPGSTVKKLDGTLGTYDFIGEMDLSNFDRDSLPELPDEIVMNLSEEKKQHSEDNFLEVKGSGVVLPEIHEGNRNSESVRVIGAILSKSDPDIWEGVIWPAIRIWNHEKVRPPQSDVALRASFNQIVAREYKKRDDEVIFNLEEKTDFHEILKQQMSEQVVDTFLTGYKNVDEVTGGFRYRNSYLVAGLEKSGKSSWLMTMLQWKLNNGSQVGYVNTEMPILEFSRRMTAYWKEIEYSSVTDEMVTSWSEKFANKFYYLGVESLTDQEKMISDISLFINKIDCLVFDNITSWGLKLVKGKESYQVTADLISQLDKLTKQNPVVTLMVMHVRPDVIINSTIRANEKALNEYRNNPESIFQKSESFVRKPTLADVYGGGQALSQISGAILIWRPYQKFSNEDMTAYTQIILESFRHSKQTSLQVYFNGKTGKFSEKKFEEFENIVDEVVEEDIVEEAQKELKEVDKPDFRNDESIITEPGEMENPL